MLRALRRWRERRRLVAEADRLAGLARQRDEVATENEYLTWAIETALAVALHINPRDVAIAARWDADTDAIRAHAEALREKAAREAAEGVKGGA